MDNSKYYEFDDLNKEIVFKRFDMPSPWMNYLSNGTFTTMMSQAGGNLSWYKSPEIWRIGRYSFYNMPVDVSGMFIYIKDLKTGKTWNPSVIPTKEKLDSFESAHGIGYTRFKATKDGVTVNLYAFVARENTLCYKMEIESIDDRKIKVFACQEMGMMEYLREVQWQCYCKNSLSIKYDRDLEYLLYSYNTDMQARPDETPRVFFTSDSKIGSFDATRKAFIGNYRDLSDPIAIEEGSCHNTELNGGDGFFALETEIDLLESKKETVSFFLGTIDKEEDINFRIGNLKKEEKSLELYKETINYWKNRFSSFEVELKDKDTERMVNTFNPLQVFVNFLVCREISFYATGTVRGIGMRDAAQDTLANIMYDLEASKEKIRLLLSYQYNSGKTVHYCYPIEKKEPVISDRSDNHLWLVYAVYQVLMEEGKLDFLKEEIEYFDGGKGTILEHIERSIEFTINNLGKDGIPLMLGSDWNDTLNTVCREGKGESVMVSEMLVLACRYLSEIYDLLGLDSSKYEEIKNRQIELINGFCWDKEWYIRCIADDGLRVGSNDERCGKIWLNSQSWAVYSKAADKEKGKLAMENALKYLDTGYGLAKLYPALTRDYPSMEKMMTPAEPGTGENGGVFCHANTWAIIALLMLKENNKAYKLYKEMLPSSIASKYGIIRYNAEPYIYSSNIRGPQASDPGQAGVSWLTGTASWMMKMLSEYMFGVRPCYDSLELDPCISDELEYVKVKRIFRGTIYNIEIDNSKKCGNRVEKIYVDGKLINGNHVLSKNEECNIKIIMG